ncbi:MAG: insulinase family protein [Bacteroidetes bacterium]|nr:insulinase family protein [Bacteroidota bacterium]
MAIVALFTLMFSDVFGQRIWVQKTLAVKDGDSEIKYWQNTNDKNQKVYTVVGSLPASFENEEFIYGIDSILNENHRLSTQAKNVNGLSVLALSSFDEELLNKVVSDFFKNGLEVATNFKVENADGYALPERPRGRNIVGLERANQIYRHTKHWTQNESTVLCYENSGVKLPWLKLTFKTNTLKTEKERMALMVLEEMLQLPSSTFRQKLLESGLCIDAKFNSGGFGGKPSFYLEPNPMGAKNAIDSFFSELYKMHQFDYSTAEQLDLAKQRLRNKWAFAEDLFTTSAIELADYQHYSTLEAFKNRANTLDSITKVDLFNAIKNHLHNKAFHIEWEYPRNTYFEHKELFRNSVAVSTVKLDFEKREMTLDNKNEKQLEELNYTLNLSPKGTLTIYSTDVRSKRSFNRAAKVLGLLIKENDHLEFRVESLRSNNSPQITFKN